MALKDHIVTEVALDGEDGFLTRREAVHPLGLMGVTGAAAAALLAACGDDDDAAPDTTSAAASTSAAPSSTVAAAATTAAAGSTTVPGASAAGEELRFTGPNGGLIGVLATAATPRGGVLVIHENRGLTPHIRSIPPRLAPLRCRSTARSRPAPTWRARRTPPSSACTPGSTVGSTAPATPPRPR